MEIVQTIIAVFIVFAAFLYILKTVFSNKENQGPCGNCQCSCSGCEEADSGIKPLIQIKEKKDSE